MTVETTTFKVTAQGNGVATSFSFNPIAIYTSDDLEVTKVNVDETEVLLTQGTGTTQYSVTVSDFPGTGAVNYPADLAGTKLQTGEKIVIKRVLEETQDTHLQNQGPYLPSTLETALDRIVCMIQQVQEEVDRSVKASIGSDINPDELLTDITQTAADSAASAQESEAWFVAFQEIYLGTYEFDPTTDNQGGPLEAGMLYFNSTSSTLMVYTGTSWTASAIASPVNFSRNVFSGTGAQTAFTLSSSPPSQQSCLVYVAGVAKYPGIDFTVSGTTLTFTSAPANAANNILALVVSFLSVGVPGDNTVTAAKMATNAVATASIQNGAVTAAKLDSGIGFGRLLGIVPFLTSGTYTKNASASYILVHGVGGGGGASFGYGLASHTAISTTGGGGGAFVKRIAAVDILATETVTIGAGGAGGTTGTPTGGTGGTTSFGTHATATGGAGGDQSTGGVPLPTTGAIAKGGIGSNGDINLRGGNGNKTTGYISGVGLATTCCGGDGGGPFGGPGAPGVSATGTAQAAINADANTGGGGGSGAGTYNTAASDVNGGAGGSGVVYVFEYS